MKRPSLKTLSRDSGTNTDEQTVNAIADALESTDKTIEIRPASRSRMGLSRLLVLAAGAVGVAYWLRSSKKPKETIQNATRETADRTLSVSQKAAETIQGGGGQMAAKIDEGGETVADRVEEGSEKAGEIVEEVGEDAAEKASREDDEESQSENASDEDDEESQSENASDEDDEESQSEDADRSGSGRL